MYNNFFYGWYFKCQSDTQTLAVIPAVHNARNKRTCSIQVITDQDAWTVTFPADLFKRTKGNIFIGADNYIKMFGDAEVWQAVILWDRLCWCHLWNAVTACGACGIWSRGMCVSMGRNILFRMQGDIGKETGGDHFPKSIYGRSVALRAGL